ncbi:AzlD domain-containing protein [Calidithermus roseus]|uniref:Branched-chain amino acid transport protein (AzlD) n=1 Tax=Calidithermus roseus TaxID=1644118 RepID=A0A399EYH8_9DEIN|nr:AzlD domain-containing protein [Calidithermus roseus]RIH89614.1 Branched-chain amino acid transport protein (AzlD) [Calidithermus roseus]
MSEFTIWMSILLAGLVTFYLRYSFIGYSHRMQTPAWFRRALRFVPAAVLSALVCKALVYYGGALQLTLSNERLLAAVVAAGVAWRTKNVLWTTVAGMLALWALQALGL